MRGLRGVVLVGLMPVACQQVSGTTTESGSVGAIAIARSEWERFVSELDRSFERIVPEVRDTNRLVAIRYFCAGHQDTKHCADGSPAAQLGLLSGDRVVAVNGKKVSGPPADAKSFVHEQMTQSARTCRLSLDLEAQDRTRTISARCR
jgi:C-terminal processing protease CtpA/Prc